MTGRNNQAAFRLSALLAGAGVLHFVAPKFFDMQVPKALPGTARMYTTVSGVAEVAVAAALAVPSTRRPGGGLAAALFVAVFPANIDMARRIVADPKSSTAMKATVLARLPLQIPLVTEAMKVRKNAAQR